VSTYAGDVVKLFAYVLEARMAQARAKLMAAVFVLILRSISIPVS